MFLRWVVVGVAVIILVHLARTLHQGQGQGQGPPQEGLRVIEVQPQQPQQPANDTLQLPKQQQKQPKQQQRQPPQPPRAPGAGVAGGAPAAPGGNASTPCRKVEDLLPGWEKGMRWYPNRCFFPSSQSISKAVVSCLKDVHVVFLGDSLVRKLSYAFRSPGHHLNKTWGPEHFNDSTSVIVFRSTEGAGTTAYIISESARKPGLAQLSPAASAAIKRADYVVVGGGMHDMGRPSAQGTPADSFLEVKRRHMQAMLTRMKPEATLVVLKLRWLHTEVKCKEGSTCRVCNNMNRTKVYREALMTAAGCLDRRGKKVKVLDTVPLTRATPDLATDGIHYHDWNSIEGDVLINHICRGNDFPFPDPPLPASCSSEALAALGKRWAADPENRPGCKGELPPP